MKEFLQDQAASRDVGLDNSRGYPNMEYNVHSPLGNTQLECC